MPQDILLPFMLQLMDEPTPFPEDLLFTVVAGKYDGEERNCKYIESFATLPEALVAFYTATDYHFCELEYKAPSGIVFDISPSAVAAYQEKFRKLRIKGNGIDADDEPVGDEPPE